MTDSDADRHRFALLRDPANLGRSPVQERVAAARRDHLRYLDALTESLSAPGGAAAEGIDAAELARIRASAQRLAEAADAALHH